MLAPIDCVTHYSLMTSTNKPEELAKTAAEYGYTSLGICDYSSVSSAVQHFSACKKYNIKPIIGIRKPNNDIFIAKNFNGWRNLLKIASCTPENERLSYDGLIFIGTDNSYNVDDFFHAEEVGLMNSHYLNKNDSNDHKILLCAKHGETLSSLSRISGNDRRFLDTDDFFFKNQQEFESSLTTKQRYNVEKINDMVESFSIFRKPMLPTTSASPEEELRALCKKRWLELGINQYEESLKQTYIDRIRRELAVIREAGLESYFLIVSDYINWAKQKGILVGPGRGSSGGCLISYLTGITAVDPIEHGLFFERFYNAGRNTKDHISYPDIDTDFPRSKREDVINYIIEKYGKYNAMRIVTFGRLQGRSAIQEVLRSHQACSKEEANRITKTLPQEDKISNELEESKEESTIRWVLNNEPDLLRDWATINDGKLYGEYANYFAQAIRLEGTFKTASIHASGIIISGEPVYNIAPVGYSDSVNGYFVGFEYTDAEKAGLLKCDILGLAALDKIMKVEE